MENNSATTESTRTDTAEFYRPAESTVIVEPTDWNKTHDMAIKLPDGIEGLPIGKVVAVGKGPVNHALSAAIYTEKDAGGASPSAFYAAYYARATPPCDPGDYILYDAYVTKATIDDHGRKRLFMPFGNVMAVVTRLHNIGRLPLGGGS